MRAAQILRRQPATYSQFLEAFLAQAAGVLVSYIPLANRSSARAYALNSQSAAVEVVTDPVQRVPESSGSGTARPRAAKPPDKAHL